MLKENAFFAYDWSYILAWVGVGSSLVSAILFSAAAICLRGEREKEEAMNMQYLMPGKHMQTSGGFATFFHLSLLESTVS